MQTSQITMNSFPQVKKFLIIKIPGNVSGKGDNYLLPSKGNFLLSQLLPILLK